MKESNYNLFLERNGRRYAFNSMTCALAEIDENFLHVLDQLRFGEKVDNEDLLTQMEYGGFVVNSDVDEQQMLRLRSWQEKFNENGFGLTIAPTLACNFSCPYCYEGSRDGVMSESVTSAVIKLVESHANKGQDIQINWYGGEPLLSLPIIESLSDKLIEACEEYGTNYKSYMVTNGYLLAPEVIDTLIKRRVVGFQITIDGPRDVHDKRRIMKADRRGTFDMIIENIHHLIRKGINPDIRINVDQTNRQRVAELIEYLAAQKLQSCHISFGHVNAYTTACADIEGTCLNVAEYAEETIAYQRVLHKYGFSCSTYPLYPGVKGNYCCADSAHSFVVDPNGYLYKCWNDIGNTDRSVGSILDSKSISSTQLMTLSDYMLWTPFDFKECRECALLPICMGGCPYNGLKRGHRPECEKWKYILKNSICFILDNESSLHL